MSVTGAALVEATLVERLRAAAAVLLETSPPPEDSCSREAGILLDRLVRAVQADCSHDRVWLLSTAMFGVYPTADEVLAGTRFLQLAPPTECALWLLDRALDRATADHRDERVAGGGGSGGGGCGSFGPPRPAHRYPAGGAAHPALLGA